jgi:hypothetical protein
VGGHVDGQVEDQRERQLRHRLRGVAGDVGDGDAAGAGGDRVDDVGAGGADARRSAGSGSAAKVSGPITALFVMMASAPLARSTMAPRGGPGMHHQHAQAGQGLPGVVLSLIGGEAVEDDDAHEGSQFSGTRRMAKPP